MKSSDYIRFSIMMCLQYMVWAVLGVIGLVTTGLFALIFKDETRN